ncbi:hypothetical protein BJG93_36980 (plasmid) [Paraburkholderia sprentiae WSM5005]|uniref:Uncharacterized protein n=1 Tax=Paraburkholderia sprentiae WSM5005 TaxID=754502 RepID=A0A8F4KIT5_9BURK|nr:hypothetical protein [Paraburkholderia sprentiae]QXE07460.1 hypothetical protein BJG93_36980 [Paraburkholderia sprentiae WSM5005]
MNNLAGGVFSLTVNRERQEPVTWREAPRSLPTNDAKTARGNVQDHALDGVPSNALL